MENPSTQPFSMVVEKLVDEDGPRSQMRDLGHRDFLSRTSFLELDGRRGARRSAGFKVGVIYVKA